MRIGRSRYLMLVGMLFCIGGCAKYYVEPSTADAATVTFANTVSYVAGLNFFVNNKICSDGRIVGKIQPHDKQTVKVQPSVPLTFRMNTLEIGGGVIKGCLPIVTFLPAQGATYRVTYYEYADKCGITVEKQDAGLFAADVTVIHRVTRNPVFASDGFCEEVSNL